MAAGWCPRCRASVPMSGRIFVWNPRVCPGCGALVRNALAGRLIGAGLMAGSGLAGPALLWVLPRALVFPLGIGGTLLGLGLVIATAYRMKVLAPGPFCTHCHYDLAASPGSACPECGRRPPWLARACHACDYDLAGLTEGSACPECGQARAT